MDCAQAESGKSKVARPTARVGHPAGDIGEADHHHAAEAIALLVVQSGKWLQETPPAIWQRMMA